MGGREKKKGSAGAAKTFISRPRALKKLQISLSEFRRLCILKGIFPRNPKKKFEGNQKTYYLVKDINFLAHERLISTIREDNAHKKKVVKARAHKRLDLLKRLALNAPKARLDHLIVERFPVFEDAIRDLDDPLCIIALFANLPAERRIGISPHRIANCQRLYREFCHWVAKTKSLRRVFVSIKGYYFQARICNINVTWITPHRFSQYIPTDVDYSVMLTFLELYECMLSFVNYRLYTSENLAYPPRNNRPASANALELDSLLIQQLPYAADIKDDEDFAQQPEVADDLVKQAEKIALQAVNEEEEDDEDDNEDDDDDDEPKDGIEEGEEEDEEDDAEEKVKKNTDKAAANDVDVRKFDDVDGNDEDEDEKSDLHEEMAGSDDKDEGKEDSEEDDGADEEQKEKKPEDANKNEDETKEKDEGSKSGKMKTDHKLFRGVFFDKKVVVGREVPFIEVEFVLRAAGASAVTREDDLPDGDDRLPGYTHWIIDRPAVVGKRDMSLEYVQPQFVFDSVNANILLPPSLYGPGLHLPPHLSPFVTAADDGGYKPWYESILERIKQGDATVIKEAATVVYKEGEALAEKGGPRKDNDEEDDDEEMEVEEEEEEEEAEEEEDVEGEEERQVLKDKSLAEKQERELSHVMLSGRQRRIYEKEKRKVREMEAKKDKLDMKRRHFEDKQEEIMSKSKKKVKR